MNDERREIAVKFRVGVFVLVALAAFLGMVYALGARARLFEAHYTIHAEFTEVAGLMEGATVRLAGVQIGRVTDVHLPGEPGGKVRVDLTIARRYADRIRRDSIARIETQGLLGDKVVEVTVGTAAAPPLQPGEVLTAREPTDFARVLTQGADTARDAAALVAALRQTAEDVNRSRLVGDVSATVAKLNRVVDQVEHGRGWAHALLYEEPVALKRLNETVTTTQKLLDRVAEGQGPRACFSRPRGRTPHGGSSGRWIGSDAWSTDPGPTRASSRHSSSNRSIRRRSRTFALSRVTSATCPTGSPAGGARSALSSPTGTPAACARSFRTCGSRWRTSRRSAKRSRRARGRSARSSRIRRSTSGS